MNAATSVGVGLRSGAYSRKRGTVFVLMGDGRRVRRIPSRQARGVAMRWDIVGGEFLRTTAFVSLAFWVSLIGLSAGAGDRLWFRVLVIALMVLAVLTFPVGVAVRHVDREPGGLSSAREAWDGPVLEETIRGWALAFALWMAVLLLGGVSERTMIVASAVASVVFLVWAPAVGIGRWRGAGSGRAAVRVTPGRLIIAYVAGGIGGTLLLWGAAVTGRVEGAAAPVQAAVLWAIVGAAVVVTSFAHRK